MTRFLLDTNVVSEPNRLRPESVVMAWLGALDPRQQYVSAVSLAEIAEGADLASASKQGTIARWLANDVRPFFRDRVVVVDEDVLRTAIRINVAGRRKGQTYAFADLLIGASVATGAFVLATRNVRDFQPMGIAVFDPWSVV